MAIVPYSSYPPPLQVDAEEDNVAEKNCDLHFHDLYAKRKEKFKEYEADYTQYLKAKYFSDKNLYGGNIFEENVTVDDKLIKSSRWPCTQSYADPVQAFEDRKEAPSSDFVRTVDSWMRRTKPDGYFTCRVGEYASFKCIEKIKAKLTGRQLELFSHTCFGHFLRVPKFVFSGKIIHHMLLREVYHPEEDDDQMFFLFNDKDVRFSIQEFALITGLNCSKETRVPHGSSRIRDRYFEGRSSISRDSLSIVFSILPGVDDYDSVKLALIYLLYDFLLPKEERDVIDPAHFDLVDDLDAFNNYPWGRLSYQETLISMKRALHGQEGRVEAKIGATLRHKKGYTLGGFPYALQVLAYESVPLIGQLYGRKVSETYPRLLNWSNEDQPEWKDLQKAGFDMPNLEVIRRLEPTEKEKQEVYIRSVFTS